MVRVKHLETRGIDFDGRVETVVPFLRTFPVAQAEHGVDFAVLDEVFLRGREANEALGVGGEGVEQLRSRGW